MSGFSLSSEPFTLMRDCNAVMVPQGDEVSLPGRTETVQVISIDPA